MEVKPDALCGAVKSEVVTVPSTRGVQSSQIRWLPAPDPRAEYTVPAICAEARGVLSSLNICGQFGFVAFSLPNKILQFQGRRQQIRFRMLVRS